MSELELAVAARRASHWEIIAAAAPVNGRLAGWDTVLCATEVERERAVALFAGRSCTVVEVMAPADADDLGLRAAVAEWVAPEDTEDRVGVFPVVVVGWRWVGPAGGRVGVVVLLVDGSTAVLRLEDGRRVEVDAVGVAGQVGLPVGELPGKRLSAVVSPGGVVGGFVWGGDPRVFGV